jgi:hypothetical protein
MLLLVDKELSASNKDKQLFNHLRNQAQKKEEYIVVLEEETYDSFSNKSELFTYNSNRSANPKISISPQPSSKSDNTNSLKDKTASKFKSYKKTTVLDAPKFTKKSLILSESMREKAKIYESYLKLKSLANILRLKPNKTKTIKSVPCSKVCLMNNEEIFSIPSPLILNTKNSLYSNEDFGFSITAEINNRDEILKAIENRSIKILKEKNLGNKKSYSILEMINHIESNKDNSIISNSHSSNSTSFYDERSYISEKNCRKTQTENFFKSPPKLNCFEEFKNSINKSASKLELAHSGHINLSPIEKSCIKLHKCDFEKPVKKKHARNQFKITLKKC